jgi:esterase/lipase superfamily enzyme
MGRGRSNAVSKGKQSTPQLGHGLQPGSQGSGYLQPLDELRGEQSSGYLNATLDGPGSTGGGQSSSYLNYTTDENQPNTDLGGLDGDQAEGGEVERELDPREKSRMQVRYDQWLTDELVPFVRADCGGTDQRFGAVGASVGAYHAFNVVCKHPDRFDTMVGMSGTYQMNRRMAGTWDEDWYFNDPIQFLPHLPAPDRDVLRQARFVFGLGEAHENPAYTWTAADALGKAGVWNRVEIWGAGSGHDWPTWRTMLPLFLDKVLG